MAGPISHVVLAERALHNFLFNKDVKQFIIGTLFPDIRYLKVIDRETTHLSGARLADVQMETDSFRAGMLFHSLIDEVREKFVVDHKVYDELPDSHLSTVALKISEDLKLLQRTDQWNVYSDYMKDILPQERDFMISDNKIHQWHSLHTRLFTSPSFLTDKAFFFSLNFNEDQTKEILELVNQINQHHLVDTYLDTFYLDLENILKRED